MSVLTPALLLGALSAPALACAVCSCGDPTLTTMGAEQPFAGRVRLALEATQRSDAVGAPGIDQVRILDQALTMSLAGSPSDRWQLAVALPLGRRVAEDVSLARTTVWSPGDLTTRARWVAWRGTRGRGSALAGLAGGLRLPTAPVARGPSGEMLPMSAQLGSGVVTTTLGAWAFRSAGAWSTYGSLEAWAPLPAPRRAGFESTPGLSARATIAGQWQPLMKAALRASLESRLDQPASLDGAPEPDTGGGILYSRLDLLLTPATDLVLQAGASLPTVQALQGHHVEGPAFALGVTLDL